jgi:hypothetical protein
MISEEKSRDLMQVSARPAIPILVRPTQKLGEGQSARFNRFYQKHCSPGIFSAPYQGVNMLMMFDCRDDGSLAISKGTIIAVQDIKETALSSPALVCHRPM